MARKIKCRRCKETFQKSEDFQSKICSRCASRCFRCDALIASHSSKGLCDACIEETKRHTPEEKRRDYSLLRRYGITIEEYKALLESQHGACWICGRLPKTRQLSVDHKHLAGEGKRNPRERRARVRGLLCWHCNNALSKFDDNPEFLRNAASYLETCPAQAILQKRNCNIK